MTGVTPPWVSRLIERLRENASVWVDAPVPTCEAWSQEANPEPWRFREAPYGSEK